jgi:hypothetical protein
MAAIGNQNARKGKWAEALATAVLVEDPVTRRRRLDAIADRLIAKAEEGDIQAIKELGDRIDGKPSQALEHTGAGGGPVVHRIERVIVDRSSA